MIKTWWWTNFDRLQDSQVGRGINGRAHGVGPNERVCRGWGGLECVGLEVCLGHPNCAVQEAFQHYQCEFHASGYCALNTKNLKIISLGMIVIALTVFEIA